jgi:DNA-binding transcriptional regulator YhcF (GntR family)
VILEVDSHSAVPPYDQIRAQITSMAAAGSLPIGTRLPAIRQLAGDLGLAPGTVARAYQELESHGIVSTHGRHGTRIAAVPVGDRHLHGAHLDEAAAAFALAATRSGSSLDQAIEALRRAFDRLAPRPATETRGPR